MNTEILKIAEQLKDAYDGEPWFGRSVQSLLKDINESLVYEKPKDQHSILELLWHIILWREFTINRIRKDDSVSIQYFEENDWQLLDHNDKSLWKKGLQKLQQTQAELIE